MQFAGYERIRKPDELVVARWSALAMIAGALLWSASWAHRGLMPVAPPGGSRPGGEAFDLRVVVSLLLFMIGLSGVQLIQSKAAGRLGKASVLVLWIGFALMAAWRVGVVDSYMSFLVGALAMLGGLVLFFIATVRAKVFSLVAVAPLIVGVLLFPAVNPEDRRALLAIPLGLAWAWLGFFQWRLAARNVG